MNLRHLSRVWIPGVCKHERTRCIHGDEGWARMRVYTLRWWKGSVIRRQACLDCGRALDRSLPDVCTVTGTPHRERAWCVQWPGGRDWRATEREAEALADWLVKSRAVEVVAVFEVLVESEGAA